ncbi:hypothetical protein D0T53_01410 [Dysgonomonas sp. 216]|uniref:hypothetical protein n=1 Tax=Dysgonomonas sp. 216 TaxID=2302934 RepID=UPI0013D1FA89|nr:hypothetical protein [Dysgonomonas sp. 216]NDW17572.1 hypothetical protein [Dysgonomonas sp. 216]
MSKFALFLNLNKYVLLGLVVGVVLGFLHWYFFGCYWGVYPMSSECWFNCTAGSLFGGFIFSLFDKRNSDY